MAGEVRKKVIDALKNAVPNGLSTRELKVISGAKTTQAIITALYSYDRIYEDTIDGQTYYYWIPESNK